MTLLLVSGLLPFALAALLTTLMHITQAVAWSLFTPLNGLEVVSYIAVLINLALFLLALASHHVIY
jgi:hypothetical protein